MTTFSLCADALYVVHMIIQKAQKRKRDSRNTSAHYVIPVAAIPGMAIYNQLVVSATTVICYLDHALFILGLALAASLMP